MLSALRSISTTWFGKILGAFLIVGLAGFGISNVLLDFGSNTVASVSGQDISMRDFQRAYNVQINSFAQQIGKVPTAEEAMAFGLPSVVINRLASDAAINKFGQDMGLGVSEDRLAKLVRDDPSFGGTLGNFDRRNFQLVLQQNGFTEDEYFKLQTNAARRQQLASALFAGSAVPEVAFDLVKRFSGDRRTVDYFVLTAETISGVVEPTEEELAAYLAQHQTEFRTTETRTADVLMLSPEALAGQQTITDEQIAAEYERIKDSLVTPERRSIQQVALTAPEQEQAFTEGKAAGKSVAEIAAENNLTVADLGTLAQSQVTDRSLGETAFGLALNDFAIIEGIGGRRVVTVTAIEPGGQLSMEEARANITRQLGIQAARNTYADILDQAEELRAASRPVSEIAERFGLQMATVDLTEDGAALAAVAELPAADRSRVGAAIFDAELGDNVPPVTLGSTRQVFFDLKKIEPARDQTLAEVHDAVLAAVTKLRTDDAMREQADKAVADLAAGVAFDQVAAGLNQFPVLSNPLGRSGDGTSVINQTVAGEIFNGGPEHFGTAVNGDGDYVVFRVVEVTPAAEAAAPQARQFVEDSTRDSLYADFVTGLRDQSGVSINRQALDRALSLDPSAVR